MRTARLSNFGAILGVILSLCVVPCIGQAAQFKVTGEVTSAQMCLVRTWFITGRLKEGVSQDLSLRLTIKPELENVGTSAASLVGYQVNPAYGTADTLKCAQDEKCLAQIYIDCFDCKSPEHLPHQVAPSVIAPAGQFSFPSDAAQFDVQLDVKGSRLRVGHNYLRFWLQLETTTTRAPNFINVHSEPIRFIVPRDIKLVRDHLSARLKETSAGLDQQICDPLP
jgi:hypothetical protein